MKGLRVIDIFKEIKFEGVWGELESKKCFQRQSFTKYLTLTLVSCEILHHGNSLISVFQELFVSINKISFWQEDWALGYHSMKFRHLSGIS